MQNEKIKEEPYLCLNQSIRHEHWNIRRWAIR
jgi:hypothetical protein